MAQKPCLTFYRYFFMSFNIRFVHYGLPDHIILVCIEHEHTVVVLLGQNRVDAKLMLAICLLSQ